MEARDILIRPLITETSTALMEEGKYVFVVDKKVVDCTTVNVMGKVKRLGRNVGRRSDYKKAIVKLAQGESIQFFEA